MATRALSKSRTYLAISAYQPEDQDMSFYDMKALNNDDNDGDEDAAHESDDVDTDFGEISSEEDMTEYVDRTWKKADDMDACDVESVENVHWVNQVHVRGPSDLYVHDDNAAQPDETILLPQYEDLFVDPVKGTNENCGDRTHVTVGFVAIMPLDFWRNVLSKTNANADKQKLSNPRGLVAGRPFIQPFRLEELMKFIGILVMMGVVRAGEYRLYWQNNNACAFMIPGTDFTHYLFIP
jgi:hypothetical protein